MKSEFFKENEGIVEAPEMSYMDIWIWKYYIETY